jgi:hypothetical protein
VNYQLKYPKLSTCLIFSCFLLSCEEDNTFKQNTIPDYAVAGQYDSTLTYFLVNPPVSIVENKIGCSFYSGSDSIDIDLDNQYDIVFVSNNQVPDWTGVCCDWPEDSTIIYDCWPSGQKSKNAYLIDSGFQLACAENYNLMCFGLNDTIKPGSQWQSKRWMYLSRSSYFPPPEIKSGFWDGNEDRYLGIRRIDQDTLYGWIKINAGETIEIKEVYFSGK